MRKYTAILIDDEEDNNLLLAHFISNFCPEVEVVDVCESLHSGYKSIVSLKPDMVFLDINLGANEDAFQLLEILGKTATKVIFVTAFPEHALKAFRYAAVDYVLKPVKINELIEAVSKAIEAIGLKNGIRGRSESLDMPIKTKDKVVFTHQTEITFFESYGKTSVVHFSNGSSIDSVMSLGYYEDSIPNPPFLRVHKSFVVNINHIKSISKKGGLSLELTGGFVVPISRRKKNEVEILLGIS